MEAAMAYLERGLEGEIEYRRAAAEANCSPFHFLRMFEVVTGVTVGEYVRRRRLSRAAHVVFCRPEGRCCNVVQDREAR